MVAYGKYLPSVKEFLQITLTFFLVVIGWIIFRAETISQAADYLACMVTNPIAGGRTFCGWGIVGFVFLGIEWIQRNKQHALQFSDVKPFNCRWVRWVIYYVLLVLIAQNIGNGQTFIYFQF